VEIQNLVACFCCKLGLLQRRANYFSDYIYKDRFCFFPFFFIVLVLDLFLKVPVQLKRAVSKHFSRRQQQRVIAQTPPHSSCGSRLSPSSGDMVGFKKTIESVYIHQLL